MFGLLVFPIFSYAIEKLAAFNVPGTLVRTKITYNCVDLLFSFIELDCLACLSDCNDLILGISLFNGNVLYDFYRWPNA